MNVRRARSDALEGVVCRLMGGTRGRGGSTTSCHSGHGREHDVACSCRPISLHATPSREHYEPPLRTREGT